MKTDLDKLEDVLRHIRNVQDNCQLLGRRLMAKGEHALGISLIRQSLSHDQSKLEGIEWDHLYAENADRDSLALAVKQHNRTNDHHPERWGGIHNMPRICIAEMICDWKARSNEFGTSLYDWVNGDAMKKFGYNSGHKVYEDICYFLELLCDKPFRPIRPESTT